MSDNEDEHVVDPEAGVIEGEDEIPRQPAPALDPYTPDPGPRPGEPGDERAFKLLRWAWVPVIVAVVLIVVALLR
jgi:hypothetical protein